MARLMGCVLLVAVALAALKSANMLWADLMSVLLLGTLLFAILGIIFARTDQRRFWTGFALFGWSSLLFISAPPWVNSHLGVRLPTFDLLWYLHSQMARVEVPTSSSEIISVWIRGEGLFWIDGAEATNEPEFNQLLEKAASSKGTAFAVVLTDSHATEQARKEAEEAVRSIKALGLKVRRQQETQTRPEYEYFGQVGRSFVTLLAALIGGSLAWFFFRRREDAARDGPTAGLPSN